LYTKGSFCLADYADTGLISIVRLASSILPLS
jgi:hypothetical protein